MPELKCCACGRPIMMKMYAFQVKHFGETLLFDRAICLSIWIDNKRRMKAEAEGVEFRS